MLLCIYTFFDQLWTICMEFGKSATNFDIPPAVTLKGLIVV